MPPCLMSHVFGMKKYMGSKLLPFDSLSIFRSAYSHLAWAFNALMTNKPGNKGSRASMQYKMIELCRDRCCTVLALLQSVTTSDPN